MNIPWEALSRAFIHPLRISILEVLTLDGGRALSPTELALELDEPKSKTAFHVNELVKAELLELVGEQPVRGTTEHFYGLRATQ